MAEGDPLRGTGAAAHNHHRTIAHTHHHHQAPNHHDRTYTRGTTPKLGGQRVEEESLEGRGGSDRGKLLPGGPARSLSNSQPGDAFPV